MGARREQGLERELWHLGLPVWVAKFCSLRVERSAGSPGIWSCQTHSLSELKRISETIQFTHPFYR